MNLAGKVLSITQALDTAGIRHAFGGAIALAYCTGEPRATRDIDVNVFVPASDVDRVFAALPAGVSASDEQRRAAERDGQVRLHWDDNPVDLFFDYADIHRAAASRAQHMPFSGAAIPVIDCTVLCVFKAFFARTKDWADIEAMAEVGSVRAGEATTWVDTLLGPDHPSAIRLRQALATEGR